VVWTDVRAGSRIFDADLGELERERLAVEHTVAFVDQ
jgi:hypothetical protein